MKAFAIGGGGNEKPQVCYVCIWLCENYMWLFLLKKKTQQNKPTDWTNNENIQIKHA